MTNEKLTKYIEKAKVIHNEYYDYTLVKDVLTTRSNIEVICPQHGVFITTLDRHINKRCKCPACSGVKKYTTST